MDPSQCAIPWGVWNVPIAEQVTSVVGLRRLDPCPLGQCMPGVVRCGFI